MVLVELTSLVMNERSDEQVICLREAAGERQFPIIIGTFEAAALDHVLSERLAARPLTHDLIGSLVTQLDAAIARVVIDDMAEDTYHAKVVLRRGKDEVLVDARPSDAITIALRAAAPIFVADRVMNRVCSG